MPGTDPLITHGLPASPDAEKALLGCILYDHRAYDMIADKIHAGDFSMDACRRVWLAIVALRNRYPSSPVDWTLLGQHLLDTQEYEAVGGSVFLDSLTSGLPRVDNVAFYAKIVREKATLRRLIHSAHNIVQEGLDGGYAEGEENRGNAVDAFVSRAQASIMAVNASEAPTLVHAAEIVPSLTRMLEKGTAQGVPTGFDELDNQISCGGWAVKELNVLMAGSQMGKTSLMLGMALSEAALGYVVCIVSLETTRERLLLRLCCQIKSIPVFQALHGWLHADQHTEIRAAMRELSQMPLYVDDSAGTSALDVTTRCRRLRAEVGAKAKMIIYVDYLQIMSMPSIRGTRNDQIAEMCRQIKGAAKELDCPIVLLSQVTDLDGEESPDIRHMRDSRTPYEQGYIVLSLFREDQLAKKDSGRILTGKAEVKILKDKDGPTGKCELAFEGKYTRFGNIEHATTSAVSCLKVNWPETSWEEAK